MASAAAMEIDPDAMVSHRFSLNKPDAINGDLHFVGALGAEELGISIFTPQAPRRADVLQALRDADIVSAAARLKAMDSECGVHVLQKLIVLDTSAPSIEATLPALVRLAVLIEGVLPSTPVPPIAADGLPPHLAPLLQYRDFAAGDDLEREQLIDERPADVARVVATVAPLVDEILAYLQATTHPWTLADHVLSDLVELCREARR